MSEETSKKKRDEVRRAKIDETLKTADQHRQPWDATDDDIVLKGGLTLDDNRFIGMDDMQIATLIGRTFVAVSQRRVVLNKLLNSGLTLEEIHEVERFNRVQRNAARASAQIDSLKRVCPECFCAPHASYCSKADG